jgi:gamma-glutamylputrescine oxidase
MTEPPPLGWVFCMRNPSSRRRFLKNAALASGGTLAAAAALNQVSPRLWRPPMGFAPNRSYWSASQAQPNPPLIADILADVVIIGGGFTGLSSAYFLLKSSPQKRVVVLEALGCGSGASGRNGAMLLTMTEDRYMNFSSDPATDRKIYDLTAENVRFLSGLSASTGIDCELDTDGALQVLNPGDDIQAAQAYVRQARSLGMPFEFWSQQQVANAIGTQVCQGGLFDPVGGHLHPMKLVRVWKAAAESAGAAIYENTVVTDIEEGPLHLVRTASGHTVKAKSLVLATNAFTARLGYLRNSIVPVQEYVAITPPLGRPKLEEIGWRRRIPWNDTRTEVFYLGLTRDNRIHIGGGRPGYRFNDGASDPNEEAWHFDQLHRELVRIYPALSDTPFELTWSGAVDWSLDGSPSVGRTGKHGNIFHGIGYSGHGVNLSSVFGRIIADLEAGREEQWKQYPFVNGCVPYVPNEPFRWLGVKAGLAWYRMTGT